MYSVSVLVQFPYDHVHMCVRVFARIINISSFSWNVFFQPGISHATLAQLATFFNEADPKDKNTVLLFDAMSVRQHLEYNNFADKVTGVEALDEHQRSPMLARCLLVFLLKSIFHGWTQVIGYHFTTATFGKEKINSLLNSYLSAIDAAGISCRAIVCDQEPSHVSAFRAAGVTPDTPYIRCPSSGRRVYVLYDPPHLLKSTRNNLMTSDFLVSFLPAYHFYVILIFDTEVVHSYLLLNENDYY